jgi:hypothetical protein
MEIKLDSEERHVGLRTQAHKTVTSRPAALNSVASGRYHGLATMAGWYLSVQPTLNKVVPFVGVDSDRGLR